MDQRLYLKTCDTELLDKNVRFTLRFQHRKNLLNRVPVAQELNSSINRWGHMKIKHFCTATKPLNRAHRQLGKQEKIFTSYTSDKGLIPKINKDMYN